MGLKVATYQDVRSRMKPGDVIAFSSNQGMSGVIKWATKSKVTHVGVIFQTKLYIEGTAQDGIFNDVMEATTVPGGRAAVISNRLSTRLKYYPGILWWLPLRQSLRDRMDLQAYYNFLLHHEHRPYDLVQAIFSALDLSPNTRLRLLARLCQSKENYSKVFCSELAAGALEASGAIEQVNASEVTPVDLCRFNLYESDYYQLKGKPLSIAGFNTLSPEGWGQF